MARKYPYTDILGWSASRYETFQTCKRKYYYSRYAKYDPVYPRGRIDYLRNMVTVPLATGSITHDVIKSTLERLQRSNAPIDTERFLQHVREECERYCAGHVFAEAYYGEANVPDLEAIFEGVVLNLRNWLGSHRFDWIQSIALRYKDDWIVEPPGFGETRIDGLKAYLKVDFLSPSEDGLLVLDWKTGRPHQSKYRRQLEGYACWASLEFGRDPAEVTAIIAYLSPDYDEDVLPADELDVDRFLERFKAETHEMYGFCTNIEENVPKDKSVFKMTEHGEICDNCNFRELCRGQV